MIEQIKITKDKTGKIGLEVNNVVADPMHFKTTDNLNALIIASDKYNIDAKDFNEIYNILKHIS